MRKPNFLSNAPQINQVANDTALPTVSHLDVLQLGVLRHSTAKRQNTKNPTRERQNQNVSQ
jgi:hypothetical protein